MTMHLQKNNQLITFCSNENRVKYQINERLEISDMITNYSMSHFIYRFVSLNYSAIFGHSLFRCVPWKIHPHYKYKHDDINWGIEHHISEITHASEIIFYSINTNSWESWNYDWQWIHPKYKSNHHNSSSVEHRKQEVCPS